MTKAGMLTTKLRIVNQEIISPMVLVVLQMVLVFVNIQIHLCAHGILNQKTLIGLQSTLLNLI